MQGERDPRRVRVNEGISATGGLDFRELMSLDRLAELFAENFTACGELGASVSVWRDGCEVLSLASGWKDRQRTQP